MYDAIYDFLSSKAGDADDTSSANLFRNKISTLIFALSGLASRIPDSKELEHRYIASSAIVKEKVGEVEDESERFSEDE